MPRLSSGATPWRRLVNSAACFPAQIHRYPVRGATDGVNAIAAPKDLLIGGLWNVYALEFRSLVAFIVEDAGNFQDQEEYPSIAQLDLGWMP